MYVCTVMIQLHVFTSLLLLPPLVLAIDALKVNIFLELLDLSSNYLLKYFDLCLIGLFLFLIHFGDCYLHTVVLETVLAVTNYFLMYHCFVQLCIMLFNNWNHQILFIT